MAELHVQAKKGGGTSWIWIVILVIIIAAIAYIVTTRNKGLNEKTNTNQRDTLSSIQHVQNIPLNG